MKTGNIRTNGQRLVFFRISWDISEILEQEREGKGGREEGNITMFIELYLHVALTAYN